MQQVSVNLASTLPGWIPAMARTYLAHTSKSMSLRAIARAQGVHASTVLRTIRRQEIKRDDPLVDEALECIERTYFTEPNVCHGLQEPPTMLSEQNVQGVNDDPRVVSEAKRILRRLCETRAFLAVAPGVAQAVVFRESGPGGLSRIAVVSRDVAHKFALLDWIEGRRVGNVGRYAITSAGRAALKRILAEETAERRRSEGKFEDISVFGEQHKEMGERWVMAEDGSGQQRIRCNMAESPITALGRKTGLDGAPFLSAQMLQASEKLREDFEIAQLGPRVAQNWDRFLTISVRHGYEPSVGDDRPSAARDRVAAALAELGPGLADVVFRCCCFLEGLETAEKRLNWSARSGKVVLRIALGRLALHYGFGPMVKLQKAA